MVRAMTWRDICVIAALILVALVFFSVVAWDPVKVLCVAVALLAVSRLPAPRRDST